MYARWDARGLVRRLAIAITMLQCIIVAYVVEITWMGPVRGMDLGWACDLGHGNFNEKSQGNFLTKMIII